MMLWYNLSLSLFGWAMWLASPFHSKARKWRKGRANLWQNLQTALKQNMKPVVWFHVSSLGEFEQARPVMEGLREREGSSFFLLLTFFSPSGYEVRKGYAQADYVSYLPLDLPAHARKWVAMVKPAKVYWVKYDFWWNLLREVQARRVPVVLFSAVFRKDQFFFKPYAQKFLHILQDFTQIFVQNPESLQILAKYHFKNSQIAGDTRFDRVLGTVANFEPVELVDKWLERTKPAHPYLLVAGSVWERDLDVLLPVLAESFVDMKFIIAPHEMHESIFQKIERALPAQTIRFSQIPTLPAQTDYSAVRGLLIDNVGMLSRLYHYGTIAYIGGAFKEGLHNILEPAVFGLPVIFGKDYQKFPEASALIHAGGAFSIQNPQMLQALLEKFLTDERFRQTSGGQARGFILKNQGGAKKILELGQ